MNKKDPIIAQLLEKNVDEGLKIFYNINFHSLLADIDTMENPYSLIFPPFLYYIGGKLEIHKNKFQYACGHLFESTKLSYQQQQNSIKAGNYQEAGENSLIRLKSEYNIAKQMGDEDFKRSYKDAKKIFTSLVDLYWEAPDFIEGLIEVERLNLKQKQKKNIDKEKIMLDLYQNAYSLYLKHAESLKGDEFDALKILNYLQALRFLSKLKKNSDLIEYKILKEVGNKVLGIITGKIFVINKEKNADSDYFLLKEKSNLVFGISKAYNYLEDWIKSIYWLKKCKNLIKGIINGVLFDEKYEIDVNPETLPRFLKNLIIAQAKFASFENKYKIDDLIISNDDLFRKYVIYDKRIETLIFLKEIINEFEDIEEKSNIDSEFITRSEKNEVYIKYTTEIENLCKFLNDFLMPEYEKDSIEQQKVKGNILFRRYSIIKTLKEL